MSQKLKVLVPASVSSDTQRKWTDVICICGSDCDAWRRRCDGVGETVEDLLRIQDTLNEHDDYYILQWHTLPSCLCLVEPSFNETIIYYQHKDT